MSNRRGFTLLELLIGLTLLGFVMALLFGAFHLASRTWDAVSVHSEKVADRQVVLSYLRRMVEQMQPIMWKKTPGLPVAFIGQPGGIHCIASVSGQVGSGLRAVEIGLAPSDQQGQIALVLKQAPLRYQAEVFDDGLAAAEGQTLLNGLDAVEFAYFGAATAEEASDWRDTWEDTKNLPKLVRIRLGWHSDGWSELIIQPMIGSSGCRWDDMSSQCK